MNKETRQKVNNIQFAKSIHFIEKLEERITDFNFVNASRFVTMKWM